MSELIEEIIAQARHSSDALRNAPFKIERESYADGIDALADALAEQATRITELESDLAELAEIYESDQRTVAWEAIASHEVFRDCYDTDGTLLDAMIKLLDGLRDW